MSFFSSIAYHTPCAPVVNQWQRFLDWVSDRGRTTDELARWQHDQIDHVSVIHRFIGEAFVVYVLTEPNDDQNVDDPADLTYTRFEGVALEVVLSLVTATCTGIVVDIDRLNHDGPFQCDWWTFLQELQAEITPSHWN